MDKHRSMSDSTVSSHSSTNDRQTISLSGATGQMISSATELTEDQNGDDSGLKEVNVECAGDINGDSSSCTEEADTIIFGYQGADLVEKYWGPTRHIGIEALTSLVEAHAAAIHGGTDAGSCTLAGSRHGVYNTAYILQFEKGPRAVVRVPACGWGERWNEKDKKLLQSTALAMKLISEKTDLPLPRVLAYDTSMKNHIGAPFILLTCIEGTSARQAWSSDDGPVPKEIRRQNLLRSLAKAISGLSILKFLKSGSLWFDDDHDSEPVVGESWNLRVEGYVIKRTFEHVDPYSSTRSKVKNDLHMFLEEEGFPDSCRNTTMKGILILYQLMVEAFLEAAEFPESDEDFVLMHSDFDIQNLLVDEQGNVTGILDWDGVSSQPRQTGWSMMPFWLQHDWSSSYHWPPAVGAKYAMLHPDEYDKYRQDYARFLWEACDGVGDCRYTSKSHLYRVLLNSLGDRFEAGRFVQNVLADILPRGRGMLYCKQTGEYGFREGEQEWLEAKLRRFFEPTGPRGPGVSQRADSAELSSIEELELRGWTRYHGDVRVRDILQMFALLVRSLFDLMVLVVFLIFGPRQQSGREKL